MEIIDPALRSSKEHQEKVEQSFGNVYWYILIGATIALTAWIIYAALSARLDVTPEESIDIRPELNEDTRGRTPSIPDTL